MADQVHLINAELRKLGIKAEAIYEPAGSTPGNTGEHMHIKSTDEKAIKAAKEAYEKEQKERKEKKVSSIDWDAQNHEVQIAQLETMKRLADHLNDIANNTA
jgi:hypothetical protein